MNRLLLLIVFLFVAVTFAEILLAQSTTEFRPLFDGTTLQGWRGRPHLDPRSESSWTDAERAAQQTAWNADRDQHWSVDAGNGELISDGHGVFLTTDEDYGDFELCLDWKMNDPRTDSGIYLRGSPQVQIWNPDNPEAAKHGAPKGSGGLWNNGDGAPGKWPLVRADRAVGEWNETRIRMIGSRVWVWLNGQLTVDGAIMENYFDRQVPIFSRGPVQLQTHGGEIRFRNLALREIPAAEANDLLRLQDGEGFSSIFNGTDAAGWSGPLDQNRIEDNTLLSQAGTIFTDEQYEDFAVQFEFKLPPGGNNGLAIRYPGEGDTAFVGMCELQVLDDSAEKYARLDPRQYHGSAYGMAAAHRGFLRAPGAWNFQRVTVRGSRIQVELNGTQILDADLSEVRDFLGDQPHPGKDQVRGHFGFAGHGDPVAYRRIELKRL